MLIASESENLSNLCGYFFHPCMWLGKCSDGQVDGREKSGLGCSRIQGGIAH